MKIIHIISGLNTGGAELALCNLLSGGLDARFDNYVVSLGEKGAIAPKIEQLGIPVIALSIKNNSFPLASFVRLIKVVKSVSPDIIQGWMYHGNLAATLVKIACSKDSVLVWNIRHSLYDLSYEKLMTRQVIRANRLFSRHSDLVLYNSAVARDQHEDFGFFVGKSEVVSNGIDTCKFQFSQVSKQKIITQLSIPPEVKLVGHVARLHPMKDHAIFLKAAELVSKQTENVHFLMVGTGVCADNLELLKLIPRCLSGKVHLLGERTDIPCLMSVMDVFVLCSAWGEGFPNVLGEAMAVGCPCVATNVGESSYIVGDTGKIVPIRDSSALAEAIESLLSLSVDERRLLGKKARQRVLKNFALDVIVRRYAELYEIAATKKARR